MINNDLLRRISKIFTFSNDKIMSIFALNNCQITAEQLSHYFKEKDDELYQPLKDVEFASFLNGLIVEKRGAKDGPEHQAEHELTNNLIFNKLKISLALKADEVIDTLALADLTLTKYELSALFRNVNHKHYKPCSDHVLSAFLKGLTIKYSH